MNLLQYLMPRVRDDIKYYGRLNFHLFQVRMTGFGRGQNVERLFDILPYCSRKFDIVSL